MRHVAGVLAGLAVFCLLCGHALGAPLIMKATKDSLICNYSTEQDCNLGGVSNQTRWAGGSGGNNYKGIADFATHDIQAGNALYDWLVANGFTPTGAAVKAAIDAGLLKVEFGVAQVQTQLNGATVEVRTIDSLNDWIENNGTSRYNNFAWTLPGGAATDTNPRQLLPSEGAALGPGWGTAGNVLFTNATYTKVSVADIAWDGVSDAYSFCTLTSEGVRQLMAEPLNRGLYTFKTNAGSNGYGYTREYSSGAKAPELVWTVIPEPATLCLLALGGGALLRRRS
jgi:hypothetical protein